MTDKDYSGSNNDMSQSQKEKSNPKDRDFKELESERLKDNDLRYSTPTSKEEE